MDRLTNYIIREVKPSALSGKVESEQPGGKYVVGVGGESVIVRGESLPVGGSVQLSFSGGAYHVVGENPGVYRRTLKQVRIAG